MLQYTEEHLYCRKRYVRMVRPMKKNNKYSLMQAENNSEADSDSGKNEKPISTIRECDSLKLQISDRPTEKIITIDEDAIRADTLNKTGNGKPPLKPISCKSLQKDTRNLIGNIKNPKLIIHKSKVCTNCLSMMNLKGLKDNETIGQDSIVNKASTWREIDIPICSQENLGEPDLIEMWQAPQKTASESSTPHRYTDYQSRLHNILLLNFSSTESEDSNSEDIKSLSSDSNDEH